MLEVVFCVGFILVGVDVYLVGVVIIFIIVYLVKFFGFDVGVMIFVLYNFYEFNGIKFFNFQGFKFFDQIEEKIEDIILNKKWDEVLYV